MKQTILITGTSTGIGFAAAVSLARADERFGMSDSG